MDKVKRKTSPPTSEKLRSEWWKLDYSQVQMVIVTFGKIQTLEKTLSVSGLSCLVLSEGSCPVPSTSTEAIFLIYLLEYPIPAAARPSQKAPHGNILGTKRLSVVS